MSTKTPHKPAAESKTIEAVSRYLECDPEIAELYLFGFFKEWGKEKYLALIRFMAWCIEHGQEDCIAATIGHDLFLKDTHDGTSPRTSTY